MHGGDYRLGILYPFCTVFVLPARLPNVNSFVDLTGLEGCLILESGGILYNRLVAPCFAGIYFPGVDYITT